MDGTPYDLRISVVIATRNRPTLVRACIDRLLPQLGGIGGGAEIIVVDDGDGSAQALEALDPRIEVVYGLGEGPGRARNRGIGVARGEIVAFTDDDAIVATNWLAVIDESFVDQPGRAGIVGTVRSVAFDPLYEHSVSDATGQGFLTCNAAYRHDVLDAIGGFDPAFRYAHEDRDLAWRAGALGTVDFIAHLEVEHPPRPFGVSEWGRRGRFVTDDWLLFARYPEQSRGVSLNKTKPLEMIVRRWISFASDPEIVRGDPRRALRLMRLGLGQILTALIVTLSTSRRSVIAAPLPPARRLRPLRIAYVGPVPNPTVGGAPGVAGLILSYLAAQGVTITCFVPVSKESDSHRDIGNINGITVVPVALEFAFGKWYSRTSLTKMLSAQVATAKGRTQASRALVEAHRSEPFDLIYQFSTIELFGLRRFRSALPPIVTQPSVHAAGELRHMIDERALSARCENSTKALIVRRWMALRAKRQLRDIKLASAVLAISKVFGDHLIADYGVDPSIVTVVPNTIDLERFSPGAAPRDGVQRIAVLNRITVRKGIDDVVDLSHRLVDLAGSVRIEVVGDHSLWSDYRRLLEDLEPTVGTYLGHRPREDVVAWLAGCSLLVQSSHYEPFGLTVAEALACGVPVVVTTEVGAGEGLDPEVCAVVPVGDRDALEKAVRRFLGVTDPAEIAARSLRCRSEAERHFSRWHVGRLAHDALRHAAGAASEGLGR